MRLQNKIFYLPNVKNVSYNSSSGKNNIMAYFDHTFNDNFKYLTFKINIELKKYYIINQICRNYCEYCSKSDCWNNPDPIKNRVASNTKYINFTFNRKYISLNNSTNTNLEIEIKGEDKEDLLFITYIKDNLEKKEINAIGNNPVILSNLTFGKYEFNYTVKNEGKPNKQYSIKNKVVLVVNYDYEIFDLSALKKNCLYYNESKGLLFTLITKNTSYKYEYYADPTELKINMEKHINKDITKDNIEFKLNGEMFQQKKLSDNLENNNEYTITLKEDNNDSIFTKIAHLVKITSFDLNQTIPFYYKDNIVTWNQRCDLDNIYLAGATNDNQKYKLKCNYYNDTNNSYCEVDYGFKNERAKTFQFLIGFDSINKYFTLNQSKSIYNAIKNSTFKLSYQKGVVSIYSNNFDMNNLYYVRIDDNYIIYNSSFINQNYEEIQFEFNNSLMKNYVRELARKEYPKDRINTIRNKSELLEIEEKPCDDYLIPYNKGCVSCLTLSEIDDDYLNRKYYQNKGCVEECKFSEGYAIFNRALFICLNCSVRTNMSGVLLCGCLEGTVKSYEDDICYLPESPEIKKLLLLKSNIQCYLEDGMTHNYCANETTEECTTYGSSGHLFPQCHCIKGYTGKYCEVKENDINLQIKIDKILSDESRNEIDETNPTIISNIRGITFFLEKNGSEYIKTIASTSIDNYIIKSIKCLDKMKENNGISSQIYDVLELALYFLKYKIEDTKNIRNLEEKEYYEKNLNYIIDNLHYANYLGNKDISQGYNIQNSGLRLVSFINYKKSEVDSDDFKYEMANTTQFKIMEYINANMSNNDYIFVTLINMSLFNNTEENNDLGVKAYFSTRNLDINIREYKDIQFFISSQDINFNYQLAQYYQDRKINIYDKKDKAFVEPCYLSKLFDFDLTQKYRKQNIFQKRYYGNENCEYINFESKFNRLIFNCTQFEEFNNIYDLKYGVLTINIKKDSIDNANKVYHLPIKCTKKIDDVGHNMAFWLFLIVCSLEVFYIIGINILNLGSLKKISYRKGLIHDELYYHIQKKDYDDEVSSNKEKLKPRKRIVNGSRTIEYETETHVDVGVDKFYKTFFDCILLNFKELHPIAALCHVSIISPLIIHSWFFVFNTLNLFGFNALIYYEALIEKRIYDKKRNNFDYPMRKEFHKIILSILCQVALCVLIKLLMMVWLEQRNDLKMGLTKCTLKPHEEINNNVVYRVDLFQNDMLLRRLIGGGIMLLIVTFFFYYSVVFCGIYIKTQSNWFYSGIWSLFWNWVIFAPIYIVIISFIEHKKENSYDPLVYNLKRLFCF